MLYCVREAVAVGVGFKRRRAESGLFRVGEAVSIGVRRKRIRAECRFLGVRESVAVGVGRGVGRVGCVVPVHLLPPVGNAVVVEVGGFRAGAFRDVEEFGGYRLFRSTGEPPRENQPRLRRRLEIFDAERMESGEKEHRTCFRLHGVRAVVVYHGFAVYRKARAVVGCKFESDGSVCRDVDVAGVVRREVVDERRRRVVPWRAGRLLVYVRDDPRLHELQRGKIRKRGYGTAGAVEGRVYAVAETFFQEERGVFGGERVAVVEIFLRVREAVSVGVERGVGGIGGVEAVRGFPEVGDSVGIGVAGFRVCAVEIFVGVGKAVGVEVERSVAGEVAEMEEFPFVRHPVAVGRKPFRAGGRDRDVVHEAGISGDDHFIERWILAAHREVFAREDAVDVYIPSRGGEVEPHRHAAEGVVNRDLERRVGDDGRAVKHDRVPESVERERNERTVVGREAYAVAGACRDPAVQPRFGAGERGCYGVRGGDGLVRLRFYHQRRRA